jgi:hypothetical protein
MSCKTCLSNGLHRFTTSYKKTSHIEHGPSLSNDGAWKVMKPNISDVIGRHLQFECCDREDLDHTDWLKSERRLKTAKNTMVDQSQKNR